MRRIMVAVILLTLSLSSLSLAAATDGEIEHLLQYVGSSKVIFIRNGQEHQPAEAVGHLAKKRHYFQDKIKSAEDFIRLCAAKSLMSGKPYQVKTGDGQVEDTQKWLTDELRHYRQETQ